MDDVAQQRRNALCAKLARIEGNKSLSPKQEQTAKALIQEIVRIDGTDVDELFKLFE